MSAQTHTAEELVPVDMPRLVMKPGLEQLGPITDHKLNARCGALLTVMSCNVKQYVDVKGMYMLQYYC